MCWPVCPTGCFTRSRRVQRLKSMRRMPLGSLMLLPGLRAAPQGRTGLQGAALLALVMVMVLVMVLSLPPRILPLPWLVLLKRRKASEARPFPGLGLRVRHCNSMPVVRLKFLQRYRFHPLGTRPATDLRRLAGGAS